MLLGTASSWTFIKAGVPEGSILGPLLFLVYIYDIVENIHASIRLFADNTGLYVIVDDLIDVANQGPVVRNVVSLTSSLRVISLTVLADSIHNILIFFAEKM